MERSWVKKPVEPYWQTSDRATVRLYQGDTRAVLRRLPEKSVQCVVTSPPYWGLRDYGTGTWEGGDPECDHIERKATDVYKTSMLGSKRHLGISHPETNAAFKAKERQFAARCGKCGAARIDQQLGSEPSPDCGTQGKAQCGGCFVCSLVSVFREVWRVLRDDGTVWLNLGDSYSGGSRGDAGGQGTSSDKQLSNGGTVERPRKQTAIPSGNLVGVPWRVALALQADGWVLRSDVIWHKPAPMPESVRNRCTKAHEYVFLLTKSMRYFYDAEAIKEKAISESYTFNGSTTDKSGANGDRQDGGPTAIGPIVSSSNKRSVWTVSSQGYPGSHFATYPPKLITPMIKAGTSEKGCCEACGAAWRRVVEETKLTRERPNDYVKRTGEEGTGNSCPNTAAGVETKTVGWEPSCKCGAEVVPCTVLDPFIGSGTTCDVSIGLGRRSVGIDLSEEYLVNNAIPRVEGALLSRPALAHLAAKPRKPIQWGRD